MPGSDAGSLQILKGEFQVHFLGKRALILKAVFWCFVGGGGAGRGLVGWGLFFSLVFGKAFAQFKK